MLRASTYLNSKDARFSLRGVYVVDSGSLHAVAEPEEPLSAALRPSELHQHTPDYRRERRVMPPVIHEAPCHNLVCSASRQRLIWVQLLRWHVRTGVKRWPALYRCPDAPCVCAVRRAALREAAKTWAFAEWQGTPGMRQRSALAATDGSRKTCKFMVDLAAASPSANGSTLSAGAAANDDNAQRAAMAFGEGGPGGAPVALTSGSRSNRVRLASHELHQ